MALGRWMIAGTVSVLFLLGMPVHAQQKWKQSVYQYLQDKLAKPDGGYGWEDERDSHLTPSYAVAGILLLINKLPADTKPLATFIKDHHPQFGPNRESGPSGTEMRDLVYQQIQGMIWLKGDVAAFKEKISGWEPQDSKVSNFESHGYPVFIQELMTPVCRHLLNMPLEDIANRYHVYLASRRRANGSFNNTKTSDGGDGNILNTYWGLYVMQLLQEQDEHKKETINWLWACQLKNGGFTHQPAPVIGANDDIAYTWAAVKALDILGVQPANVQSCIQYILSLRNGDGGFGKQPGQPSNPVATYYALDALNTLHALAALEKAVVSRQVARKPSLDLKGLKVFTVQFEASGSGSPEEAVMLADSLHIHLWGAKNEYADASWIRTAQRIADEKKVPVVFFRSDETHAKLLDMPGLGSFTHVMDYIAPPASQPLTVQKNSSWAAFRDDHLQPLWNDQGALIWQVSNNEPLTRILLDETVKNGGYAAISTIHFGQNFLYWMPTLDQYRWQIPYVTLQDAHGEESWWWAAELANHRTLFLAREATYAEMIGALKENRVVAVRHDSLTNYKTRMLGGGAGVQEYINSKASSWQWWDKSSKKTDLPWAAITVLKAADSFEVARPDAGITIRIRCLRKTIRQFVYEPLVRLETLTVDGKEVKPEYVEKKDNRGQLADCYYLYPMPASTTATHTVEATLRHIGTNETRKMARQFN